MVSISITVKMPVIGESTSYNPAFNWNESLRKKEVKIAHSIIPCFGQKSAPEDRCQIDNLTPLIRG